MHEGHRRRMYEKLKNDDGLHDHEILEILLFNAFPRKNTNPVAHSLLQMFGSLSGVFAADIEQLMSVDGVGESVALYIKCVAECNKRANINTSGIAVLRNHAAFKEFAALRLRGKTVEVMELYFLDKNGKVKRICPFTSDELNKVVVASDKISKILAAEKPYGLVVAHNHLSGNCLPSMSDNRFTAEMQLICSIHNVTLFDHIIYATDKEIFSYYLTGNLEKLKNDFFFFAVVSEKMDKFYGGKKDR